ncbi:putative SLC26A/SulP transporter, STAS domain superfamily [Plasmopara halstedii]
MSWLRTLFITQSHSGADDCFERTWQQRMQHYAPIFRWLPQYSIQRDLKFDVVAGITVAMMLIPQEVSLSTIMHLPAHHGLYTAALAPLIYAIFGSSTVLSVASGSEVSLLVGSTLEKIENEDERVATSIFMAFLSGCILLLVRIFNLSQIADFFSRPVMGGFISAGGLLIMLSQVPNALGLKLKSQDFPPAKVVQILENLGDTNLNACAVAVLSILYLILVKKVKKRMFPSPVIMQLFQVKSPEKKKVEEDENIGQRTSNIRPDMSPGQQSRTYQTQQTPQNEQDVHKIEQSSKSLPAMFFLRTFCDLGPLFVCIFGGIGGYVLGPTHLKLTGEIPRGFPEPKLPWYGFTSHLINSDRFGTIMYHTVTVSIVVFLSSIAMAKRLAIQRGEDINTKQELTGIGIASVICGFFQGVPPTGGMSRTAVNLQNAHTQLASIITCLIVIFALYTLTSTLYYLPSATLASIIIVAGWSLVEFREAKWLYHVKRDEFVVWSASFASTLGLGVLNGLIASVLCCILVLMWKSKVDPIVILGEMENGHFVDRNNFPQSTQLSDIIAIRVERSLYFANCECVPQFIDREMQRLIILGIDPRGVVLDTIHMNDMDATTIQVLSDTQEKLAKRKVHFAIANAKSRVAHILTATNLPKRIVAGDPTISVGDAIHMIRELTQFGNKSTNNLV